MSKLRPDQNQETEKPTSDKPLKPAKHLSEPKPDSPMGRFNNAVRKILSVPKKNLKDK
jgi:hypothetical protein